MSMHSIPCPVLGAHITLETDLEGTTTQVICPEYEESGGTCHLKKAARQGGPLSELLERAREDALDTRSTRCNFKP
ncbi:MAG TPA: hypothetical protein VFP91_05195 [Vicinamibacterales bacterium]|nr:hypothetical protein [Vicinamibacterales bacterium]